MRDGHRHADRERRGVPPHRRNGGEQDEHVEHREDDTPALAVENQRRHRDQRQQRDEEIEAALREHAREQQAGTVYGHGIQAVRCRARRPAARVRGFYAAVAETSGNRRNRALQIRPAKRPIALTQVKPTGARAGAACVQGIRAAFSAAPRPEDPASPTTFKESNMKRTAITLSAVAIAIAATLAIAQPGGWGGGPGAGCGNGPGAGAGQAAADGTCPMGQGRGMGMGMGPGAGHGMGPGGRGQGGRRRDAADAGRANRVSRPDACDDDRRGLQGNDDRASRIDRAARQGAGRDGAGRSARRSLRADEGTRPPVLSRTDRSANPRRRRQAAAGAIAFYASSPACAISAALPPAAVVLIVTVRSAHRRANA